MSRIFFLDDMTIRRERFAKAHMGHEIVFAETPQEAISILSRDLDWDIISLDHDLGGEIFVDSNKDNTGYQVAKFLSDKNVKGEIVIHSFNPIGAKKMMDLLPQAVYKPFLFLICQILAF